MDLNTLSASVSECARSNGAGPREHALQRSPSIRVVDHAPKQRIQTSLYVENLAPVWLLSLKFVQFKCSYGWFLLILGSCSLLGNLKNGEIWKLNVFRFVREISSEKRLKGTTFLLKYIYDTTAGNQGNLLIHWFP